MNRMRILSRGLLLPILLSLLSALTGALAQRVTPAEQANTLSALLSENPKARVAVHEGAISRMYGNVPTTGTSLLDSAANFVAAYGAAFGARPDDLVASRFTDIGGGKFLVVWFAQTAHGVKIDQAGITVLVRPGEINQVVLASPIIRDAPTYPPSGLISPDLAVQAVRAHMPHANKIGTPEFLIWSVEGSEPRYAYKIEARTHNLEEPERWFYYVDAATGRILERRDGIYYVDVVGRMDAWATPGNLPDTAYNPTEFVPLPGGRARIVGGNTVYADQFGNFTIPNPGTSDVTVEGHLIGRWVNVQNVAGANEVLSVVVTPPGPVNFVFNQSRTEFVTSQVNGFIHTEMVRNFAKAINPSYPGIDIQMLCRVNINATCNAYYDGNINFYRQGGACVNTAYTTVVYHEYGHHIVAAGHNNPSGAFHEGMADVTAMFLADDPIVGRDFRGPGNHVRNPPGAMVQYPCTGGSHYCGQVLGGAFWHTMLNLRAKLGHNAGMAHASYLYLNVILLSPPINPQITIDVLTLDDNDGDITNGTPNYDEIDAGFSLHNLPAPPLSRVTDLEIDPPAVVEGSTAVGTVHLRSSAPTGGGVVTLTSSNPAAAQVPPQVVVPEGQTQASFNITTSPGSAPATVTITATRLSHSTEAQLNVIKLELDSMSFEPSQVTGGAQSILTLNFNGAVPAGGADVHFSSNSPAVLIPPVVHVPAGSETITIPVNTLPVQATTTARVTGWVNTSPRSAELTVVIPIADAVTVDPSAVNGGSTATGTVYLTGPAAAGGALVQLSSSNTSATTVPPSVTVPEGETQASFTINTNRVASSTLVSIRATRWVVKTAPLTVLPPTLTGMSLTPSTVRGGRNSSARISISAPAPANFVVNIGTSNPAYTTVPTTVTIPQGATSATFTVGTRRPPTNTTAIITASRNNIMVQATLQITR